MSLEETTLASIELSLKRLAATSFSILMAEAEILARLTGKQPAVLLQELVKFGEDCAARSDAQPDQNNDQRPA